MEKIKAKKKYGQNFLSGGDFIERIAECSNPFSGRLFLEIGPGTGLLTAPLLERALHLDAVEIDNDMKRFLNPLEVSSKGKLRVAYGDFMSMDIDEILSQSGKYCVFANIPYYITAPIIEKLIYNRDRFSDIFLTVQKEAAERICAKEGSRASGSFSFFVEYYAKRELLFIIPKEAFEPVPKVDSAFIHLNIRNNPPVNTPWEIIEPVIRTSFLQRRKNLRNSLKELCPDIDSVLEIADVKPSARPESLSLVQFSKIAEIISRLK